jgi:hypothetical protein
MCTDNPHPVPLFQHIARYIHNLSEINLLCKATSYAVIFADIFLLRTIMIHYSLVVITAHHPINKGFQHFLPDFSRAILHIVLVAGDSPEELDDTKRSNH